MRNGALTLALLAAIAAPAHADPGSQLWSATLAEPSDYQKHMTAADQAAMLAAQRYDYGHGTALQSVLGTAIREYEAAIAADPNAPEPHYRAAELIYAHYIHDRQIPDVSLTKRAIEHWRSWEKLAPRDPRLEWALFRRSIAFTKLGGDDNLRLAIADYEEQLRLTDESTPDAATNAALVLSNTAELYMAVGDLDESITLYMRAIELSDKALYGYGLALALERDGQGVKAREVMRNYAHSDQLRQLSENGVFFIPEGEVHAYKALGYDALGDVTQAITHYEAYLRFQGKSRWAKRVGARLDELRRHVSDRPASRGKAKKKPAPPGGAAG